MDDDYAGADIALAGEPMDFVLRRDGLRGYVPLFREDQIAVLDMVGHKVE